MLKDFKKLKISLASPKQILSWSCGEVKKAETINYRTQRAEVDGLMCEKIFGPTTSYQCYCGKYKKIRYKGIICDKCGVEVTHNRVRRERMGHIKLAAPVVHTWFSYGIPNKLSLMLDIPKKQLEAVIYFARYIVIDVDKQKKKDITKDVESKMKDEIKQNDDELNDEIQKLKKTFNKEKAKIKSKGKAGLELESKKVKNEKEIAKLKELYLRKQEKIEQKYEDLLSLIDSIVVGSVISEEQNSNLKDVGARFYKVQMGAEGIKTLLGLLDLKKELKRLIDAKQATRSKIKKGRIVKRLRILEGLSNNEIDPTWIVMEVIPVIPPALRPIIQLPGGRFATSDLNDLYRRVINRNNRLKRLIDLGAPEIILRNEKRMLQEAVDALIDNSHRQGRPVLNSRAQPYKSLSDILRGKQGRFRQNLLGKRVDYSGRAVIVSGPELSLYECGLPKDVALELFKPFVIREIIAKGLSPNIKSAKNYLEEKSGEVWDILENVIEDRPVLLNRAPTLHKQGIQAFFPVLTEGNAIRVHPMVCKGFNADFDGDQMAVHVPLSKKAVEEALERMMPDSNMLLMANGNPVVNVKKDMSLGLYLLTKMKNAKKNIKWFANKEEAMGFCDLGYMGINDKIKILINDEVVETSLGRIIFNEKFPKDFGFVNEQVDQSKAGKIIAKCFKEYGKEETVKILDYFKEIGFKYATLLGFSVSMDDFVSTDKREDILKKAEDQIHKLNESFYNGLITEEERKSLSEEVWMKATEEISDLTWKEYEARSVVVELEKSGAYPVKNPTRQISAIRGLILDPLGNIVELPLRSNYVLGLSSLEYFVAARGTRKGLTDIALKTARSGYLTRKMIDVAQDVITRTDDCGTDKGIYLRKSDNRRIDFEIRITGRWTAENLVNKETGEVIVKKDKEINEDVASKIVKQGIDEVKVRSPLTCTAPEGICRKCYGYSLGDKKLVKKGIAVGVVAAQAMGEAATQLTLDSKHLAGRAGTDITQGLPRVEELFEARMPKGSAVLSEVDGKAKFVETDGVVEKIEVISKEEIKRKFNVNKGDKVVRKRSGKIKIGNLLIKKKSGRKIKAPFTGYLAIKKDKLLLKGTRIIEKEYKVNPDDIIIKDNEKVKIGDQLTSGSVAPNQLKNLKGLLEAQKYIIDNVQETYGLQGISIDDKHVEVIVRKMAALVIIEEPGDSDYLPGEYANYYRVLSKNKKLKKYKTKEHIRYKRRLLGITASSINTQSFLSAASFQEVVRVLSDAAIMGKVDKLRGLKENVIIGRHVPLGEYLR